MMTKEFRRQVKIVSDKGYLRLQFSSNTSQVFWNKRQYYKALGLAETPENWLKAEKIAHEIEQDILFGKLDPSLNKYSVSMQAKLQTELEYKLPLVNKEYTLQQLYDKYCDFIKNTVAETTYKRKYRGIYLKTIQQCPQELNKSLEIYETILQKRRSDFAKSLIGMLYDMFEWAKYNKLISDDVQNSYKFLYDQMPSHKSKKALPQAVKKLTPKPKSNYRGFKEDEVPHILEALSNRGWTGKKGKWRKPVEFLFLTGCRMGEAAGLKWKDIADNFRFIHYCRSYEPDYKIIKDTKTGEERYFPCNQQVQNFLKCLKEESDSNDPEDFVFGGKEPINFNSLNAIWSGHPGGKRKKAYASLIGRLIEEGKVEQYFPPYAARHTWINQQLRAGVPIQNVAQWAGNSPETILKNYISFDDSIEVPVEIPI